MKRAFSILFVCHELPPNPHGGIGVIVESLARKLSEKSIRVGIVGLDFGVDQFKASKSEDVQIYKVPYPRKSWWYELLQKSGVLKPLYDRIYFQSFFKQAIKTFRPDLIESYEWSGPIVFPPSVPMIIRLHGSHTVTTKMAGKSPRFSIKLLENRTLQLGQYFCSISNSIAENTRKEFQLGEVSITRIPNFLHESYIRSGQESRGRIGNRFVFLGRGTELKGLKEGILTFAEIQKRDPESKLTVIGQVESQYRSYIGKSIQKFQDLNISWKGAIDRSSVKRELENADILLNPTRAEAFGLNVLESMSCGLMVFSNKVGGITEILKDGYNGFFVDFNNPREVSERIREVVGNPDLVEKVREAASDAAHRYYSPEAIVKKNIDFYSYCLKKSELENGR